MLATFIFVANIVYFSYTAQMNTVFKRMRTIFTVVFTAAVFYLPYIFSAAYAQEVLIKKNEFNSEIYLRISPGAVRDIAAKGSSITIRFKQEISNTFEKKLDDPYFISITGRGDKVDVILKPAADYAVFSDQSGIRIIAAAQKEKDDVLLSYGMGAPLLRKQNRYTEDPVVESSLRDIERLFKDNQTALALDKMHNLYTNTENEYYKQEALYRLANMYLEDAKTHPESYAEASRIYDQFISNYPDSNRIQQARMGSAKAKKESGLITEAIAAYQAIFNTSVDAETRRDALMQIADLYAGIGQYDRAIDAYNTYLANFKTGSDLVKAQIGKLNLLRGAKNEAYAMFDNTSASAILTILTPQEQIAFAHILEEQGHTDRAIELYNAVVHDGGEYAPQARYNLAEIAKQKGNLSEYSKILQGLGNDSVNTEYGLRALVEYAELHYADKMADDWRSFLQPVYNGEDVYDLRHRADLVQIKAMYDDNETDRIVPMIDEYIKQYSTSPDLPFLLKVKEDVLYGQAVTAQNEGDYDRALSLYKTILTEFPNTSRRSAIEKSMDDIYYTKAMAFYNNHQFASTIGAAETRILEEPPASQRWYTLREDAIYNNIVANLGTAGTKQTIFRTRDYLTEFPRGRYVSQLRDVLKSTFDYPFKSAYAAKNSAEALSLYGYNKAWLDIWPDQGYNDEIKTLAALSFINMGMRDNALSLYQTITPSITNEYAGLSYALCQPQKIFDVNKFTLEEFNAAVDAAASCDNVDYSLDLIHGYTSNKAASLKAEFDLMKNVSDDTKRIAILNNLYSQIQASTAAKFDGYEDVYLDVGVAAYKRNDFAGALVPLQQYVDTSTANDDKKAEALYYMGKSFFALNEKSRSMATFQRIIDSMPDSLYKNMARNELEDNSWKKSITGNNK